MKPSDVFWHLKANGFDYALSDRVALDVVRVQLRARAECVEFVDLFGAETIIAREKIDCLWHTSIESRARERAFWADFEAEIESAPEKKEWER